MPLGDKQPLQRLLGLQVFRHEFQGVLKGDHRLARLAVLLELGTLQVVGLGISQPQRRIRLQLGLDQRRVDAVGALELPERVVVILQDQEGLPLLEVDLRRGICRAQKPDPVLAHLRVGRGDLCIFHQGGVEITFALELLGLAESGAPGGAAGKKQGRQHQDGDRSYTMHAVAP